ncbi:MAG: RNA polymerase subunit sigma-24 [Verrucomicrobia bacterium]|nr:MAG: RNA polymerase subunit sigma-24 [Verrucomicrobiota bacterium]
MSPSEDEVTSLTGVGPSAAGQYGAVAFATTHWSVVLSAQGESPAAHEALEKLCRIYWVVRKEKGRLRSYLLVSLKHFLSDERRRAMTAKRGKGQRPIPLEELGANERADIEPADPLTAERIYERHWASTVLEQVFRRLKDEYHGAGNATLFDCLKQLLPDEPGAPSQGEIAARLGMTENAIRQAFHRFRRRYQFLLREEIAHTVAMPSDIEDELRHLIAVVRA